MGSSGAGMAPRVVPNWSNGAGPLNLYTDQSLDTDCPKERDLVLGEASLLATRNFWRGTQQQGDELGIYETHYSVYNTFRLHQKPFQEVEVSLVFSLFLAPFSQRFLDFALEHHKAI